MGISRRKLLQVAGTATVGAALGVHRQVFAQGAKKKLKILQWNHFVPGYDKWFNGTYIKEWGEKNDTEVTVDNVGIPALNPTAASEVSAKKGHDLFLFLWPRPVYENDVIDHKEIYEECEKKYGKPIDLAIKSTYNPKTKKYHGFSDSYVPGPDQLPEGPLGRDRDEARQLGRHPRRRGEDQAEDRHPGGHRPGLRRSTPPWRCGPSSTPSAARSRTRTAS